MKRQPSSAVGTERHSADFYDQRDEFVVLGPGDRLLVPYAGGPSTSRLETYPPRLEVAERGGTYVLEDDGAREVALPVRARPALSGLRQFGSSPRPAEGRHQPRRGGSAGSHRALRCASGGCDGSGASWSCHSGAGNQRSPCSARVALVRRVHDARGDRPTRTASAVVENDASGSPRLALAFEPLDWG